MHVFEKPIILPKVIQGKTTVVPLLSADELFQAENAVIQNTKPGDILCISQYSLPSLHEAPSRGTPASDAQRNFLSNLVNQVKTNKVSAYVVADNSQNQNSQANPQSQRRNEETLCFLNQEGIFALPYPKDYVLINHSKFVANNNYAVVSSCNLSSHSSDSPDYNTGFLLAGLAARNGILSTFLPQWNFAVQKDNRSWASKYPELVKKWNIIPDPSAQWLNTAPKEESNTKDDLTEIKSAYESLIHEAGLGSPDAALYFAHFDLSNLQIVNAVLNAHQMNPSLDIRFILDPNQYLEGLQQGTHDPRVIAYQSLLQNNILVRFARVLPHPFAFQDPQRFHDKYAVYNEEKVMNGSGNLSSHSLNGNAQYKSVLHNRETDVLVTDVFSAKKFKDKFLDDWNYRSVADPYLAARKEGLR